MLNGKTVFAQLISFLPRYQFKKCVKRYRGNHKVRKFSCWDQFLTMVFAQLTFRSSLRSTVSILNSRRSKLYQMGFRCKISLSTVVLTGVKTAKNYPEKLRRVRYFDVDKNKDLIFITNNFLLDPIVIANLYKCRWQVELFFKWIKQHLRIKSFYGTFPNAVKTQIWIAVCVYILIAIVNKQLNLDVSLYTFLDILSTSPFEEVNILQLLTNEEKKVTVSRISNQLNLLNL